MDINKGITKFDDTLIFKKFRPSFYHFHFQMNTIWTNEPNFFGITLMLCIKVIDYQNTHHGNYLVYHP